MSKNQEYAEKYAAFAMEQMRKYGIPASVTLAQGILESSNGQSRLALNENNHFGIKATPQWIAQGGKYGIYTDDKPNEKFCSYDSVGALTSTIPNSLLRTSDTQPVSPCLPMTIKAGRKDSPRPGMPVAVIMPKVCKRSLKPTGCRSMTRWSWLK